MDWAFQSTLPQGKWQQLAKNVASDVKISIHTSAREVTWPHWLQPSFRSYFNPHFRKGSDRSVCMAGWKYQISIHTSAREVTRHIWMKENGCWHFNPHFRKGSDVLLRCVPITDHSISIHTSAREVTGISVQVRCYMRYFNPHFRKGSDGIPEKLNKKMMISIHTSAREVTAIFHKNICLFLWNIYKYIWIYFRILLKYSVYTKSTFKFVYFYRCESPGNFMYARHSHLQIIRIKADRLQFLVLHLYALSWSYNYFQDSRIASYLLYHQ